MKKRTNKKILVTGVCGLIGSHLLDVLLAEGHSVTGVDDLSFGKMRNIGSACSHPRFRFFKMDVCRIHEQARKLGRFDVIFHLAAVKKVSEKDPVIPTSIVNATGTESVMKLASLHKTLVILGSTSDVYGLSPEIPFREDGLSLIGSSTAKRWAYAISKLQAEHIALGYYKDFGVPAVILRYFGAFSERSSDSWSGGHIPLFIHAVLKGESVVIHGDGKQTRSMAHVDDLVRGTCLAMQRPAAVGEIINIGNDEEVSVIQSARMIHRLSGVRRPLKIRFVPMKNVFGSYQEISRRVPDLSKAKKLLGYRPSVTFEQAVLRVIRRHQETPA